MNSNASTPNQVSTILSNASDIAKKAQDLNDKIHPHVIRVNVWSIYLRFANDIFPILFRYVKLKLDISFKEALESSAKTTIKN